MPVPIAQAGGAITRVAYQSAALALISRGRMLEKVNLANPASPIIVSSTDIGETISDIAVSGSTAYVSYRRSIVAYDVSTTPPTPLTQSTLPGNELATIGHLHRIGTRLYVHAGTTHVYDLGIPSAPSYLTSIPVFADGITASGSLVYLSSVAFNTSVHTLRIYDISTPATPVARVVVQTAGSFGFQHSLAVSGNRLYSSIGTVLKTFDISNPDAPAQLTSTIAPAQITELAISGSLFASMRPAFSAPSGGGLVVFSLANPSAPSQSSVLPINGESIDLSLGSNRAHLACAEGGVQVVNITDPAAPALLGGQLTVPGIGNGITIVGNNAFVASGRIGVWIMDVSNPALLQPVGYALTTDARSVAVSGNRMYVADGVAGMKIFNITTVNSPMLLGSFLPPGGFHTVRIGISGTTAVLCGIQNGGAVHIVDVSNPAAPVLRSTIDTDDYFFDVAMNGTTAYFANSYRGLSIYSIANPAAPVARFIGTPGPQQSRCITASGSTVYLGSSTLQIVDASAPEFPLLVGQVPVATGGLDEVRVVGDKVYAASFLGTQIIDISQPARPVTISQLNSFEFPQAVGVHSSGRIIEGDGYGGLAVYSALSGWAPAFRDLLVNRASCPHATVDLSNNFSASPAPTSYQWFRGTTPLSDGATGTGSIISGAAGPTLQIANLSASDAATYYCLVSNTCAAAGVRSNGIALTICRPDFNCSGTLSVQDIFDFLAAWFAADPNADFNSAGGLSVQDIFDFLNAWFVGC